MSFLKHSPRAATASLLAAASVLGACSPYPDSGEFLAGVVFSMNFIRGTKTIDSLEAIGRGQAGDEFAPYTIVATSAANTAATSVTSMAVAAGPFWTDATKRNPLAVQTAGKGVWFDGSCAHDSGYRYDERLDLVRMDRQYPVFADIPELLTSNGGKPGRTGSYSAVVEVVHVRAPGSMPCQSIKRYDTALGRIGKDLTEVRREYRLLQIIDPAIAVVPLPFQLGFFNQLVVPYIDMGPVPVSADGQTFVTMPVYKIAGTSVVAGTAAEVAPGGDGVAQPIYSPICQDFAVGTFMGDPPPDVSDPVYKTATKTSSLSSCVVCKTLDVDGHLACPFAQSQDQAQ